MVVTQSQWSVFEFDLKMATQSFRKLVLIVAGVMAAYLVLGHLTLMVEVK
jgi:hypothetical protein